MNRKTHFLHNAIAVRCAFILCVLLIVSRGVVGQCTDILILGDAKIKPVAEVITGIRKTVHSSPKIIAPGDLKASLSSIVVAENAKVVIALGQEAVDKALQIPSSIPVICGLVITSPKNGRSNITYGLMTTPVSEYMNFMRQNFPAIKKVAVFSSPEMQRSLPTGFQGQLMVYQAGTSFELIAKIRQLNGIEALLLLPDVAIMTATSLEEVYLYSFRNRVPVLGVSEKHVKQGSLFALVFDSFTIGSQIGEKAIEILSGANSAMPPSFSARKFNLYINTDTAHKMGIFISDDLLRRAKKVYP